MGLDNSYTSYSLVSNTFSYMGRQLSRDIDDADLVIMGIPYDMSASGRGGTRHGPQGIRLASANLRWEEKRWPWRFNAFDRLNVVDYGDLEFPPGESQAMVDTVTTHADRIFGAGKKLLSFGGDHFVTLPLLRAAHKVHGKLALVHFDAHTDTEDTAETRYYHGGMFHHAPREDLISPEHSIQIGIRTEYDYDNHPFQVLDAATANDQTPEQVSQQIRDRVGDRPVYLSFDIDCLDPAHAPGTGTPVVGGLSSDHALKILRGLSGVNLAAMDVVEVSPPYDHSEITALAGATLGLDYIYLQAFRS